MSLASLSARELAQEVLLHAADRRQIPSRLLDEQLADSPLTPSQRGHATDLVHGVVRRQPTLDLLLKQFIRRPLPQVEAGALVWLRIAAWELLFSPTPSYAVLNETAEAVKRQGQPQWTGFLNGMLRSLTRDLTDQQLADTIGVHVNTIQRARNKLATLDSVAEARLGAAFGEDAMLFTPLSESSSNHISPYLI